MPPFSLSDDQMRAILIAAQPLDPSKRCTLLERVAGHLWRIGVRHPTDADSERAEMQRLNRMQIYNARYGGGHQRELSASTVVMRRPESGRMFPRCSAANFACLWEPDQYVAIAF